MAPMFCNQLPENKFAPAPQTPRFAQATLLGLGGIAVFVVAGEWAPGLAALMPVGARLAPGGVARGWLRGPGGETIDEALLSRLPALAAHPTPSSPPGGGTEADAAPLWLLTCHGGTACALAVRRALIAAGCVAAGERGGDAPPAPALFPSVWAGLAAACRTREQALRVAAVCAANDLTALPALQALLRPRRVCLAGAPNAGKSSLFNALLAGEHALVTPLPGTTRDSVSRPASFGAFAGELVDTAGFRREGAGALETAAQARGAAELAGADVVLWVVAASEAKNYDDANAEAAAAVAAAGRPVVVAHNKCDLLPGRVVPETARAWAAGALAAARPAYAPNVAPNATPIVAHVAVAAIDGFGLGELRAALARALELPS